MVSNSCLSKISDVVDIVVDVKKINIPMVEDLEFGIADDGCLVEYEEDRTSVNTDPVSFQEDGPIIESLVQELQDEWMHQSDNICSQKINEGKRVVVKDDVEPTLNIHKLSAADPILKNNHVKNVTKRARSYPPDQPDSVGSGRWSVEWLKEVQLHRKREPMKSDARNGSKEEVYVAKI